MRTCIVILPWLALTVLVGIFFASWNSGGIVAELFSSQLTAADRVERLQDFFRSAGIWAPVAYIGFVVAEVVIAPIPGLMLYAPGGLIFGPWYGGLLALVGNVIGSGLACARALTTKSQRPRLQDPAAWRGVVASTRSSLTLHSGRPDHARGLGFSRAI